MVSQVVFLSRLKGISFNLVVKNFALLLLKIYIFYLYNIFAYFYKACINIYLQFTIFIYFF